MLQDKMNYEMLKCPQFVHFVHSQTMLVNVKQFNLKKKVKQYVNSPKY